MLLFFNASLIIVAPDDKAHMSSEDLQTFRNFLWKMKHNVVGVVSVYVYNTHTDMSEYFEGTRTDIRCRLNKRVSRALYVQEWIRFGLAEYSNSV
jgi:hypothetical protein